MTDTIYTPSEMVAHVEAQVAALSERHAALSAALVEAESEADCDRAQRISIARNLCVLDITTLFDALNAP
jgi:phage I-like protein